MNPSVLLPVHGLYEQKNLPEHVLQVGGSVDQPID